MALLQSAVADASAQLTKILGQFEDAAGNLVGVTAARLHDEILTALSGLTALETKANADIESDVNELLDRLDGLTITPQGPLGSITGPIQINLRKKTP